MGWQDAPVVGAAPAAKPKWADAPTVAPEAPAADDNDMSQWVPTPGGGFRTPSGKIIAPPSTQSAPDSYSNWDAFKDDAAAVGRDLWTTLKGIPETVATGINNAGANITAGLTAPFVAGSDDDQANYIRDFQEQNLAHPSGESAQKLTAALGDAFDLGPLKQTLGEGTLNATGSPLAATLADAAPDLGAMLLGGRSGAGAAEKGLEAIGPKAVAPVSPIVGDLRAADIRMRPSDVRAMNPDKSVKVPGEFREKFASGPALKNEMTLHNQAQLTKANAKDLGVKDLTESSLEKAKEAPGAVYDMVEQVLADKPRSADLDSAFKEASASARLPKGDSASVTRVLGALRRRAAKRLQSDDVKTEDAGFADRDMADRLEEELGRELKVNGEPQLFDEFKDARKQFAKIHDVETATRAGQIDANVVYKLGKRGVPLSGALKLTADAAEHAPNVTGHSLKTAARAGEEVPSSKEGIFTRGTKALIRKIPGMDVGTEGFQQTLGRSDPARASYYGHEPDIAPVPGPRQGDLDLESLMLQPPPGVARPLVELNQTAFDLNDVMLGDEPLVARPPEAASTQGDLGVALPALMRKKPKRRE